MLSRLKFIIFFICLGTSALGQQIIPCGTVEYLEGLNELNPGLSEHLDKHYQESIAFAKGKKLFKTPPIDTTYELTVVFHVLYNNGLENINDSFIHTQMEALNASYNRQNADTSKTREIFKSVAGNPRISFKLATEDPEGNPTSGINRVFTNMTSFYNGGGTITNDYVKNAAAGGVNAWNTEKYLNIWVCDLSFNGQAVLLGYAFPPPGAARWNSNSYVETYRQGVVLHFGAVGRNNPFLNGAAFNTAEKTAVHEVGHFLGLRHVWGDPGARQNGCDIDDQIDDTPMAQNASSGVTCRLSKNTCTTQDDQPDMIENYMDYSNGPCTNMFTKQQVEAMRYNLHVLRPNLPERTFVEGPHPDFGKTKVYPNPTSGNIKIYIHEPLDNEKVYVLLYDMLGRIVLEKDLISDYVVQVPTGGLAAGYYKIEIQSELRDELLRSTIVKYD